MHRPLISLVGSGVASKGETDAAYEVGRLLAIRGFGIVCGGLGGVMEAACRGASEAGGLTVGILPGFDPAEVNPFVAVALPSGLGEARNIMVVRAGIAVIAVGGEYGTLSEIGFAMKTGKRVVGLETWELRRNGIVDAGILIAASPEDAVNMALR